MPERYEYRWNLAYRVDHWARFAALAVLTLTGFYIHWPFSLTGPSAPVPYEPHAWPVMAWMRFWHFVAGYVLVTGLVVRIYLAFNSRFDADWRDFGLWRNIRGVPGIVKYYLFLKPNHPPYRRYNPLQALTYLFWVLLIAVQALTGFALYEGTVFGIWPAPDTFLWVRHSLGGESEVRLVHHLGMWVFLITVGVHVYMAAMTAWTQRDHSFRAMFTGHALKQGAHE
ncbi:MAG: Ni/Fe-hydrogenase, b-type cytochrome subunit [Deltaproteobacteria bacterium]